MLPGWHNIVITLAFPYGEYEEIKFGEVLGRGNFGTVHKGECLEGTGSCTKVTKDSTRDGWHPDIGKQPRGGCTEVWM